MAFDGFEQRRIETSGCDINVRIGGQGPPLLLLHGYPQTHYMWHKVARQFAERYTVVAPDLRGYGDSGRPDDGENHYGYSKRAMAQDQAEVMTALGHDRFLLVGHDRGGRVAHRLTLDHQERVEKIAVLDIVPTYTIFSQTNQALATAYFHWFFLIQKEPFPETLIGNNVDFYLRTLFGRWGASGSAFTEAALAEYFRCFKSSNTVHTTCEDYRAGAGIDLEHDEASRGQKITCPLLVLWGRNAVMERLYDVVAVWREWADDVRGQSIDCGHFIPEEAPEAMMPPLLEFLGS